MKTEIQSSSNSTISNGMCRLCLSHCDDENSVEIFNNNYQSLLVRIMACAGLEVCLQFNNIFFKFNYTDIWNNSQYLQVTEQDPLPKRICLECRLILEKSFLFRNKCKNSDSKLRRHFRLINAGKGEKL